MPTLAHRIAAVAALTVAIIAADIGASVSAQSDDEQAGRIVARRLADGRTEFGWQPTGGERILPRLRYFPANVDHQRWLNSSPIEVGSEEIGRINVRLADDGRIEFAFTPTDGERIEPSARYFPVDARVGRWLRSTEIAISAAPTAGFSAVSAGSSDYTCALRVSGEIECWGANSDGQIDAPAGRFAAVSAGYEYTCGLHESGEIECWGNTGDDGSSGAYTAVSVGSSVTFLLGGPAYQPVHTCGLREDGAIECWGSNDWRYKPTPAGRFTAVSAGHEHTCGLRDSGEIACWGANDYGQVDAPDGRFAAVSAGHEHTCGLRDSGEIACWGSDLVRRWNGETGTLEEVYGGQTDAPAGRFTAVSAGGGHTCALREDGAIACWGYGSAGQTDAPAP